MSWVFLFFAGLLEIGWALGLKYTDGFTRLGPSLWTVAAMIGSFVLLGQALRVLPIGIYWLKVEEGLIDWGVVMAGTLFVVLPVLIVFLYAQRYIVEGIAAGAVKG